MGGYGGRKFRVLEVCGWVVGVWLVEEFLGGGRKLGWDVGVGR